MKLEKHFVPKKYPDQNQADYWGSMTINSITGFLFLHLSLLSKINAMRMFVLRILISALVLTPFSHQTQKPVLHGKNWMAITGKPLAATAGAITFQKGGNAVDAACAMLAATCTMWDVLSWGGETQVLLYNPKTKKVIADFTL